MAKTMHFIIQLIVVYSKVIEIKNIQNISYSVDVQQYLVFMSDIENL